MVPTGPKKPSPMLHAHKAFSQIFYRIFLKNTGTGICMWVLKWLKCDLSKNGECFFSFLFLSMTHLKLKLKKRERTSCCSSSSSSSVILQQHLWTHPPTKNAKTAMCGIKRAQHDSKTIFFPPKRRSLLLCAKKRNECGTSAIIKIHFFIARAVI